MWESSERQMTRRGLSRVLESWRTPVSSDSLPDSVACLRYYWPQEAGGGRHAESYLWIKK